MKLDEEKGNAKKRAKRSLRKRKSTLLKTNLSKRGAASSWRSPFSRFRSLLLTLMDQINEESNPRN